MATARRSGRREKLAQRAAPPVINPCPPGQTGGQYKPLTEPECQAIFDMALRLLSELGMGEVPGDLADLLISRGAIAKGDRVLLPGDLVMNCLASAPVLARKSILTRRDLQTRG